MLSRSSFVAKKVLSRASVLGASREAAARTFSSESEAAASSVSLNFSVPYESIYNGASVEQVIIPGVEGEYGVTANHVPYVAQMKPGILTVMFDSSESEKYFVAGGYAVTHSNSVTVSYYYYFIL
jgi:F-type H+-transporting ATPase subunit delta